MENNIVDLATLFAASRRIDRIGLNLDRKIWGPVSLLIEQQRQALTVALREKGIEFDDFELDFDANSIFLHNARRIQ